MEQKRLFSEVISLEISWLKDDPIVQLGPKLNTKIALNHHHQSTYFGPNFRKWSEFGLFCKYQSEFAQKVRIFQFLSLSLPKNLEKEALA